MTRPQLVLDGDGTPITPELVLEAYRARCFPMADSRDGRFHWYRPEVRAVITWDRYRIPRTVRAAVRKATYTITYDRAFQQVVERCAERRQTWICRDIETLFVALHDRGLAHSVEAWSADGHLVGGLYGLVLGGCFCGESMFHRADDASKICVVHLVDRLMANGFSMLDCQQQTPHMARFGAEEIPDERYAELLAGCSEARSFP